MEIEKKIVGLAQFENEMIKVDTSTAKPRPAKRS